VPSTYQTQKEHFAQTLPSAATGLYSPTDSSKGITLKTTFTDKMNDILFGRAPVSGVENLVAEWRSDGGDIIRAEYEKAYQQANAQIPCSAVCNLTLTARRREAERQSRSQRPERTVWLVRASRIRNLQRSATATSTVACSAADNSCNLKRSICSQPHSPASTRELRLHLVH
jgi:hypothetical protein